MSDSPVPDSSRAGGASEAGPHGVLSGASTGGGAPEASAPAGSPRASSKEDERFGGLPPWLRPRSVELTGTGSMRLIETTLLVLVAVLLATATINDVARQSGVNRRLITDLKTWRTYTGHDYHDLSIEQEVFGASSQRDVVCGNTSGGPPKSQPQICLAIWGAQTGGHRQVHGGWYLPTFTEDEAAKRYGCFGQAGRGRCPR